MYRVTGGLTLVSDGFAELSYRSREGWVCFDDPGPEAAMAVALIGDEAAGPAMFMMSVLPRGTVAPAPAHCHASDNFRVSLLGTLSMGREEYRAGRFRFQQGWRAYPDECVDAEEGAWQLVMMADRRGARRRIVPALSPESPEANLEIETHRAIADAFGITGDFLFPDDPSDTAGPSALASTLGRAEASGKLNGSFDDCASWLPVNGTTRAAVSLIGDAESGPVVILSVIDALGVVSPRARFGTELFRLVVAGSCEIEGRVYERGDMRVQHAGTWCGPIVAGAEGLQEVLVIGDRRMADPAVENGSWAFGDVVHGLLDELPGSAARSSNG